MNWRKLKEFCNSLPENELDKKVIVWSKSRSISQIEVKQLQEDYYIDIENCEKGCFPQSLAKTVIKKQNFHQNMDDLEKVYDKGFPVLYEDK